MKKLCKIVGFSLLALSGLIFESCSNDSSEDVTTVVTLDKPANVNVTSFAGGNYISWDSVKDATGYEVYRVENSKAVFLTQTSSSARNWADIVSSTNALTDGTYYTYEVVAKGSNTGIFVRDSEASSSYSVYSNIPEFGTAPNAPNATPSLGNGYILVPFTQTAGYSYQFASVDASDLLQKTIKNAFDSASASATSIDTEYTGSVSNIAKLSIPSSGEKNILVKVSYVSPLYDVTYANLGSVTVPSIGEIKPTTKAKAQYTSTTSVLVSWTPAVLDSGNAPTSDYKIYRVSDGKWTDISTYRTKYEGINATDTSNVSESYSITDYISDNSIAYTYYIVLTDGTNYGTVAEATLSKYTAAATDEPIFTSLTYVNNYIKAEVEKGNSNQSLSLSYVKLSENIAEETITSYISSDYFNTVSLENENGYDDSYINYIYASEGTYLFKLVASETGKQDSVVYKTVTANGTSVPTSGLSVTYSESSSTSSSSAYVKVYESSSTSSYIYNLYKLVTTIDTSYPYHVRVETNAVGSDSLSLSYDSSTSRYSVTQSVDKKSSDHNVTTEYYVVKALSSDSTKIAKVKAEDGLNIPEISYSSSQKKLTWNSIENATGYRVYYYSSSNFELEDSLSTDNFTSGNSNYVAATEYSASPLWKNYEYLAVKACGYVNDVFETTEFSNVVRIDPSLPSVNISNSNDTLSWNSVDGATSYYIYRNDTDSFSDSDAYYAYVPADSTSYTVSGKGYYYAVRAYKSDEQTYTDFSNSINISE